MGYAVIRGSSYYTINQSANTISLAVSEIDNNSSEGTGTIRLELWLTTTPWDKTGSNTGYEIATDRLNGSSNGQLGPNQFFSNVSATVPYVNHPPTGTYFVTLAVAEYTGASPNIDGGYVIDSTQTLPSFLYVDSNGVLSNSSSAVPKISIASNSIIEGNSGSKNLVFTITLSSPTPYDVTVMADTNGETALLELITKQFISLSHSKLAQIPRQ